MNFLRKTFNNKKPKEKLVTLSSALQHLNETEETLEKRQIYLEEEIHKEIEVARAHSHKNNRKGAYDALRRKKRLERQLSQVDGALTKLEYHRDALETANVNVTATTAMGEAGKALKNAQKTMSVDTIDCLYDNISSYREMNDEITQVLSQPINSTVDDQEDEELAKELEKLVVIEQPIEEPKENEQKAIRKPAIKTKEKIPLPAT